MGKITIRIIDERKKSYRGIMVGLATFAVIAIVFLGVLTSKTSQYAEGGPESTADIITNQ